MITGAAGVGKSLLVAAALEGFTPRPAVVLSGAARVHDPAPYDWLAAVLSGRDTAGSTCRRTRWPGSPSSPPRRASATRPGTLLRLAVRTVRLLVGAGPAVLVVEDLHALDPASLNLVGELATAPELPALLVVASRPPADAVAPDLTVRALARLSGYAARCASTSRPLAAAEVAEVLAQVYDGPAPRRAGRRPRSGGAPAATRTG